MLAIVVSHTGGPDVLVPTQLPDPRPRPHEVVVDAAAVGVNFLDVQARAGHRPVALPFTPGHEGAGTISAVGHEVRDLSIGDRVAWAWPGVTSSYAQRTVVPAEWIIPLPEGIEFETAAAALIQGMTALYLASGTYPVSAGDTVLVHAGAGGVGSMLTQIIKNRGGHVISTVSTAAKAAWARELGADHVISYTDCDFPDEVSRITGGHGVAAIYDGVGKATFDGNLRSLAPRGVLAIYGQASGPIPPLQTERLITAGSIFLTRTSLTHYAPRPADLKTLAAHVLNMIETNTLQVHIGASYDLTDADKAHHALEQRQTTAKLLLIP